jgi:ferredoxin
MAELWDVKVDQGKCIGNKMCASVAPANFEIIDGKSRPIHDQVERSDEVGSAWEMCPMAAISLFDESGEEVVLLD